MNINAILDGCFEDQIRAEFSVLMQSLVQGDVEGAGQRFENGVALAKQARDIAAKILNSLGS